MATSVDESTGRPPMPMDDSKRTGSLDEARRLRNEGILKAKLTSTFQRQASLPANAPHPSSPSRMKLPPKIAKGLVRMNSNPHILPSEEEGREDTLDEIDLLHNIAKTPNMLSLTANGGKKGGGGLGVGLGGAPGHEGGAIGKNASPADRKKLLVKQKSLKKTLSTSVLRIPKKKTFWSWA